MKEYINQAETIALFKQETGVFSYMHYRQVAANNGFKWKPADTYTEGTTKYNKREAILRFCEFLKTNQLIGRCKKS